MGLDALTRMQSNQGVQREDARGGPQIIKGPAVPSSTITDGSLQTPLHLEHLECTRRGLAAVRPSTGSRLRVEELLRSDVDGRFYGR